MKSIIALLLVLGAIFQSCEKANESLVPTKNITIKNSEVYKFDLGFFGYEEGASISKQAINFTSSELERDGTGKIVFTFVPTPNYVGTEEIEIKMLKGSDGASQGTAAYNTIKLNITN